MKASNESTGGWQVSQTVAGRAVPAKSEGTRWVFTFRANPEAAEPLQNQLAREQGPWLDTKLRQRLGRVAARLQQPVTTALQTWNPQLVVTDEAHRVKEAASRRTRAVRAMCAGRRVLLMTGTPLRNHAGDGKALLEIISPERIWKVLGRDPQETREVVKDLLARRMIRRRKKEVLKELPPKLRQRIPVRIEAAKLEGYNDMMHEAEKLFDRVWAQTGSPSEARKAAMGLWNKAQRELGLAKLDTGVPIEYIREVIEAKGCAIVFAHHLDVLARLQTQLQATGISVGRIDGKTKPAARTDIVRRFQAGKLQVFLGGILAAGEAITLTRAETVIFIELAWVPGQLLQAEDRGHRAGQTAAKYHIIHLVAEIVPPPTPKPPEGLEPLIPLPELLPKDYRRLERTGIASPAWEAAEAKLLQNLELHEKYASEQEQAQRLAAVENIDQHMIDALGAKTAHIDEVLGEESDAMFADGEQGSGIARLAQATEERVQFRRAGQRPA